MNNIKDDNNGVYSGNKLDKLEVINFLQGCKADSAKWIPEHASEHNSPATASTINAGVHDTNHMNGRGSLIYTSNSLCQKTHNIENVTGEFDNGKLKGHGTVYYKNDGFLIANFHKGAIHGLARRFQCEFGLCDQFEGSWSRPTHLSEV